MKKKVLILTGQYPYGTGEPFIEDELSSWHMNSVELTLVPFIKAAGRSRLNYNTGSVFNHSISLSFVAALSCAVRCLFIKYLIFELVYIFGKYKFKGFFLLKACLKEWVLICVSGKILSQFNSRSPVEDFDLVYSYWNSSFAVAAEIMKSELKCSKVVTRAHGFDLYEERRPGSYYPFKRQFANKFDVVVFLTEDARKYYKTRYGRVGNDDFVARLGVSPHRNHLSEPLIVGEIGDVLRVVTVSNMVEVKRLDRVVDLIAMLAVYPEMREKSIEWTHYGDGPEKENVIKRWDNKCSNLANVKLSLKGYVENSRLVKELSSSDYHFFVNLSDSEGVPVSIMEAMLSGLFVVATNVGSTSDLVKNGVTGVLIDKYNEERAVEFIVRYLGVAEREEVIKSARRRVLKCFNSKRNHDEFVFRLLGF